MNLLLFAAVAAGIIILLLIVNKMRNTGIMQTGYSEALKLIEEPDILLLDVRTADEFASGHLRNAKNIPVQELQSRMNEISSCKDKPVLVYCYSGGRSAMACGLLKRNGFLKISNLSGGISSWTAASGKVYK